MRNLTPKNRPPVKPMTTGFVYTPEQRAKDAATRAAHPPFWLVLNATTAARIEAEAGE